MNSTFRQIVRHASVFGAGAVLFRLASVALLPLYTRHLAPADYGVLAILDLSVSLLAIVVGGGVGSAAIRSHCTAEGNAHHPAVWWTAMFAVFCAATPLISAALAGRSTISHFIFGPAVSQGPYFLALALPTLWAGTFTSVIENYFRSTKASSFLVLMGLLRLFINVGLNVLFLVRFEMGVAGVLWGNLLSAVVIGALEIGFLVRRLGPPVIDKSLLAPYWRFGGPLILHGLLSTVMHQADRYLLRRSVDLGSVGLYSVAYQIGQGVNTLVILPFAAVWSPLVYEVARQKDAGRTYARVFEYFVYGLSLVLLLTSMLARPILALVAPPSYAPAADLVPIVCLAYLFFSLHEHFKVPVLLSGRTVDFLPVVTTAAAANIGINLVAIPRYGAVAAAWASVATFAIFSFGGLARYRRTARYPYALARTAVQVAGMIASYGLYAAFILPYLGTLAQGAVGLFVTVGWAALLFHAPIRNWLMHRATGTPVELHL